MPQVLGREKTTLESAVEAPERREFREPQPPPRKEIGPVRWIAWVVALMTVALAGMFVFDMVRDAGDGTITSDGSFEANELARMQTLAPQAITSDGSYEANELARMQALAPELDDSIEINEMARFMRLAPDEATG